MKSSRAAKPHYECQVCDKPLLYETEAEFDRKYAKWMTHTFCAVEGEILVLTCPTCGKLDAMSIMLCYMDRVRSGRDRNYH